MDINVAPTFNCIDDHKDAHLASLYSQVNFLKNEVEEKNLLIRTLIIKENKKYNYDYQSSTVSEDENTTYNNGDQISDKRINISIKSDNSDLSNSSVSSVASTRTSTSAITSKDEELEENTILVASDSICNQIDEKRLSKKYTVKVRAFSGASINDMYWYLHPLLIT
jgi:hypothetical protein